MKGSGYEKSNNVINVQLSDNQENFISELQAGIFLRILMIIHLNYLLMARRQSVVSSI